MVNWQQHIGLNQLGVKSSRTLFCFLIYYLPICIFVYGMIKYLWYKKISHRSFRHTQYVLYVFNSHRIVCNYNLTWSKALPYGCHGFCSRQSHTSRDSCRGPGPWFESPDSPWSCWAQAGVATRGAGAPPGRLMNDCTPWWLLCDPPNWGQEMTVFIYNIFIEHTH